MKRTPASFLLAALFAACRVGEAEPVPIVGEGPRSIAVWPLPAVSDGGEGDAPIATDLVHAGLVQAVIARGYRTTGPAVAVQLLAQRGQSAATPAAAAAREALAVDAVLHVLVRELTARGRAPLQEAQWDLEWRLIASTTGAVVWSFAHRGGYRHRHDDFGDPHRPLDAEPEIVPIGGRGQRPFRDAEELLATLHRLAMERLPRCAR